MAKIVPSERLRRELDEVLAGVGEHDDPVEAIARLGARLIMQQALEDEVASLQDKLETRKAVDRAKGLLMTRQKMTEPEAFRWIQRTAMDRRTTMRTVADAVIEEFA